MNPDDRWRRHLHRRAELRGDSYGDWTAPGVPGETGWGRSEWDRSEWGVYPDERELERDRPWRTEHAVAGPHAGKGPKGYVRNAQRIREDVIHALTRDPYIDASEIEVHVDAGEVTLTGTVDHRRTKR